MREVILLTKISTRIFRGSSGSGVSRRGSSGSGAVRGAVSRGAVPVARGPSLRSFSVSLSGWFIF